MRPTIKDVAKLARVAPSTVSRALNRTGYVSDAAKIRIDQAAADLNFRPNWVARVLKGKPCHLIGLIMPEVRSISQMTFVHAASHALRAQGYDLILCVNEEDADVDLRHLTLLHEKQVDGVLYCLPADGSNSAFVRDLARNGLPIVEVIRCRETDMLDSIIADDGRGAYRMTQMLIRMGHRRIALIDGAHRVSIIQQRFEGYSRALKDAGLPIDADLIFAKSFSREHGEEAAERALRLADPPTAIFSGGERLLLGILTVLQSRGLRIPDDISVVAGTLAEWVSVWNPPITAIGAAVPEMARVAVDVLLRRITTPSSGNRPVTYSVSAHLIEGASVKRLSNEPTGVPLDEW